MTTISYTWMCARLTAALLLAAALGMSEPRASLAQLAPPQPQQAAPAQPRPQTPPLPGSARSLSLEAPFPLPPQPETAPGSGNTTVVPRISTEGPASPNIAVVKLVALLTADGQTIDQGLVWRIYEDSARKDQKPKLTQTLRDAAPTVRLAPGDYVVNASFGRAHITRKISVKAGAPVTEQFVLNAGGLRVTALLGSQPAPNSMVSFSILSDEREQINSRSVLLANAKPGLIVRLNAGLYQIVSTYGDANAVIRADVTVEAGKLTEATMAHAAARVAFKLVTRAGGEAIADTQWSIQTLQGESVKESVGALPTHHLAPGNYAAIAKSSGRMWRRDFSVKSGDNVEVEIIAK